MIRLKKLLEDIPMGDVAFGDRKDLAKLQNAPIEDNTSAENELKKLLIKWFAGSPDEDESQGEWTGYISTQLNNIKSDLFKLKKQFPKVFDTNNTNFAFRGTNVPNAYTDVYNYLKAAKNIYIVESHDQLSSDPVIVIPYTYKPKSPVQSWSAKETIAKTFSNYGLRNLILLSKVDSSFIMNPKASNLLSGLPESEMLHFGKSITTYLVIGSVNADNTFVILYEILEGLPPNTLQDSDEDMIKACYTHENFKKVCKVIPDYDSLPW
jgi:hypothetical protein